MILVLTGTHHQPFDRLVQYAERLGQEGLRVVVQAGSCKRPAPHCEVFDYRSPATLEVLTAEATVVVCHAGPGSLQLAWARGLRPIVVPRSAALGEHVDDHQLRYAASLGDRAVVVVDLVGLRQALKRGPGVLEPGGGAVGLDSKETSAAFGALAERLVQASRHRRGLRGTLRNALFSLGNRPR